MRLIINIYSVRKPRVLMRGKNPELTRRLKPRVSFLTEFIIKFKEEWGWLRLSQKSIRKLKKAR